MTAIYREEEYMRSIRAQAEYVAYYSTEQRTARMKAAREETEKVVGDAHRLFFSGDREGAIDCLHSAGFDCDGVLSILEVWRSNHN